MSPLMNQFLTEGMNEDVLTHRLRSIANNSIREAMIAIGRGNWPWTDDDSRRSEMIFKILHLARPNEIMEESESFPLVAPQQAKPSEEIMNAEKAVSKIKLPKSGKHHINEAAAKALENLSQMEG